MNFTSVEYDARELSRDVSNMISVTIEENEALYRYLLTYIAKNLVGKGQNLYLDVLTSKASSIMEEEKHVVGRIVLKLGTGEYSFLGLDGKVFHALHHMVGKPVGTDCGAKVLKRLIIFSDGSWEELASFLHQIVEKMNTTEEDKFICYSWKIRYSYWDEEAKVNKRPVDSVVLPTSLKSRLINDMTKFLDEKTKAFYLRNGIPYRRSYLFYGTPGTGKTSMVQALAGHFGRNVCFLMPTHPEMTDDSLRSAVNSIPENSIVVFEDIDALFDKDRSNQVQKSSLTFSGLLNALDGIGSANGQVFVLTTNLRENLDHALIRNGRVDLHFEFSYAIAEQMELMWRNFYPDAVHLAVDFASAVMTLLNDNKLQVTTSALQHYFVTQMDATPEEALANVSLIVEEIRQNSSRSMLKEATTASNNDTSGKKKKNKSKKNKNGDGSQQVEKKEESMPASEKAPASAPVATATANADSTANTAGGGSGGNAGKKKRNRNKNKKNQESADTAKPVNEAPISTPATSAPVTSVSVPVSDSVPVFDAATNKKKKNNKNKNKKDGANVGSSVAEQGNEEGKVANGDEGIKNVATEPIAQSHEGEAAEASSTVPVVDGELAPLSKRQRKNRTRHNEKKNPDEQGEEKSAAVNEAKEVNVDQPN